MYSVMRWVVFRDAPRGLRLDAALATGYSCPSHRPVIT